MNSGDSKNPRMFSTLPDIFEEVGTPNRYEGELEKVPFYVFSNRICYAIHKILMFYSESGRGDRLKCQQG